MRNLIVGLTFLVSVFCVNAEQKTVKFDGTGGIVTPATMVVSDDGVYGELPVPNALAGKEFGGWWTAKTGGIKVAEGDAVDFSIFANPKTPVLYAQWLQVREITVVGGYLGDGSTTQNVWPGDEVDVYYNDRKLLDRYGNEVNAFASWTVSTSDYDLGEGFDPFFEDVTVTMPNANVKLTANYIDGFSAYLYFSYETRGTAGPGDFYWSVDNGKTKIPFGYQYPVRAGTVTVKFYDLSGLWHAPSDMRVAVDARGSYKSGGVVYYDDPGEIERSVTFTSVEGSYQVAFDGNGEKMNLAPIWGVEGGQYSGLPIPTRKGYLFAGWYTAKTGGTLVKNGDDCDPTIFAGQTAKVPTLYAHWLKVNTFTVVGSGAYASWSWSDEQLGTLPESVTGVEYVNWTDSHGVMNVPSGAKVKVEATIDSVDSRGNSLAFQKWTVSPIKSDLGTDFVVTDFETSFTMPDINLTLTATYIDESVCGYLSAEALAYSVKLGWDYDLEEAILLDPPYRAFEWSPDKGKTWYKSGMQAMLKAGQYSVTWRSMDENWQAPTAKATVLVEQGEEAYVKSDYGFTFIPQVVVDVVTLDSSSESAVGGTVSIDLKNGVVPVGKTITLTASESKGYAFQGWAFERYWEYGSKFDETAKSWKIENYQYYDEFYLEEYLCDDAKVHVVAVFKALSDYRAEDLEFFGLKGQGVNGRAVAYLDDAGRDNIDIYAMAGCALDGTYSLDCSHLAQPLTYKTVGIVPAGIKFDAKNNLISGTPTKAGEFSFAIVATDAAKNSKSVTVNVHVREMSGGWIVGDYRAMTGKTRWYEFWDEESETYEEYAEPQGQNGLLELSVSTTGKVSAKFITCVGSRACSGAIAWSPDEGDLANGAGTFFFRAAETKNEEECEVYFYEDGAIDGYADSYYAVEDDWIGGEFTGMRQDKDLLAQSNLLDKYYTFAFYAESTQDDLDESTMPFGYGYLTLKADKKGSVKVAGQLPDGEKVSMSALWLPEADYAGNIWATLYVFASPSSYKKEDWFAMSLQVLPDGTIESLPGAAWTIAGVGNDFDEDDDDDYPYDDYDGDGEGDDEVIAEGPQVTLFGFGAEYSSAQTLENYYWNLSCASSDQVLHDYSWKAMGFDANGKVVSSTEYGYASALSFEGYFFNVAVSGNSKGTISLTGKSPKPWNDGGVWNYSTDKKGNAITDPSQLSISFAKATGIFTGTATVYFDYEKPSYKKNARTGEIDETWTKQHSSAALPYVGVMILTGAENYVGLGSALYSYNFTEVDGKGQSNKQTVKVSLPVSLVNQQ